MAAARSTEEMDARILAALSRTEPQLIGALMDGTQLPTWQMDGLQKALHRLKKQGRVRYTQKGWVRS